MSESTKKTTTKKFIIILSLLLAIVITIVSSSYIIFNELETQLQQNLEDVATQNALALHNKIHSNYNLLNSLSVNMHDVTLDNVEEKLHALEIFIDEYDLKRFAYSFPDGICYSTDGGVADLSYREFFQRGMQGKSTITGILHDALEESHGLANVMTIPIFDENGKVEGAFSLTYRSQNFNDALQIDCFNGLGYSCAISDDGQILVAMKHDDILQLSENLFTDVLGADPRNADTITTLQKLMRKNASDGGVFYLEGKNYYHCVPVSLMGGDVTWYMLTIVPANVLESKVLPIQENLYLMAVIVSIFIFIGAGYVITLSRDQKNLALRHAYEDPLTKGANYAKFCLDMNKEQGTPGYLISMDITNFNHINIAAGRSAGNQMISDIWGILTDELRAGEFAGHVQDDIFSIFLKTEDKNIFIERLKQFSARINRRAKELQIMGIHSRYGVYEMQGDENLEDAYSKAKVAREQARSQRETSYVFYDEIDHEQLAQNQQFEESLANQDFEVWYQPKYSAITGNVVGSEALVRWRDTDGSLIPPGRFIPLFEQNGMIAKLDEYMFRAVCGQQKQWLAKGQKIYPVSINLSRASLYYVDIIERYQTMIQEYEIDPAFIQIEITESSLEGRSDIQELLEQFRNMGIRILMDDFGTGYSSLSTLNMQCFDTLKLDKSLIDHIGDKNGETLLFYVISMGQKLGLHITAEGVENDIQLEFLKTNHCDDIQGFLFAKPMPSAEFEQILAHS